MSYNIPKVATKIVDKSELAKVQSGGRVVLIPYFSKYGSEDFTTLYSQFDKNGEHVLLGKENAKRYGLGVTFIKGALSVPGVEVLGKRLLPEDAQFANKTRTITKDAQSKSVVTDTAINSTTIPGLLSNATGSRFSVHAKSRGEGYNDIVVSTKIDRDMELSFADDEGKVIFPYNFFTSDVYESTSKGLVLLEAGIRFSLMETDPDGNAFINPVTNRNLFFTNVESDYIGFVADQNAIDGMEDLVSMDEVRTDTQTSANALPLFKDKVTSSIYELKEQDGEVVVVRAQAGELDEPELAFEMATADGKDSMKIEVINKVLTITKTGSGTATFGIIAGESAYKTFTLDKASVLTLGESVVSQRTSISEFLTGSKYIKMTNGTDGVGLVNGKRFNMSNTVADTTANGKSLLVNFYSKTAALYETIFPKYAFDYVVDWSGEDAVKSVINNLTSNIGISLGVVSAPYATKSVSDTDWRSDVFYASNMHTAIYSGQVNIAHYDASAKTNISMISSYYAMIKHLMIDNEYSITEPVANITKGQIPVAGAKLSYAPNAAEIEKLIMAGINPFVVETDGKYLIHQLTSYKKNSKLTRINNVKTLHVIRKALPPLLKDLLQLKATGDIISTANNRVSNYMSKWTVGPNNLTDGIFTSVNAIPYFDETTNELTIFLNVVFVGIVESISIPIIVK